MKRNLPGAVGGFYAAGIDECIAQPEDVGFRADLCVNIANATDGCRIENRWLVVCNRGKC